MQKEEKQNKLVISYLALRRLIGFFGLLLPLVLVIGAAVTSGCCEIQDSISHYYYTSMRDVFIGVIFAIGTFLITYKGYDNDRRATNLAGFLAFMVALFPTDMVPQSSCDIYCMPDNPVRIWIHYIAAILLFTTLAYISIKLFVKSEDGTPTKQKIIRNKFFRGCGVVMLVCILMIILFRTIPILQPFSLAYHLTFYLETVILTAFGLSWLIKGELILKDN